jgi:hypothetical protein
MSILGELSSPKGGAGKTVAIVLADVPQWMADCAFMQTQSTTCQQMM